MALLLSSRPGPVRGGWLAVLLVGAATLVGGWLRISLASSSGLWRDEVQSLAVSRLASVKEVIEFLVREESHPPLFYLVERVWTSVVGTSDAAVVALGLVPGIFLIPFSAFVGWRLGGRWAGILAAWFVALAWPLVWHGADGRPYALLSVLSLAGCYAGLRLFSRPSGAGHWAWYVLCLIALAYTHNWAMLIVASLALLTLEAAWRSTEPRRPRLARWAIAHLVVGLAYLPWVSVVLLQARNAGYPPAAGFPVEWIVSVPIMYLAVGTKLLVPALAGIAIGAWGALRPSAPGSPPHFLAAVAVLPWLLALLAWPLVNVTFLHCAQVLTVQVMVGIALVLGRAGTNEVSALGKAMRIAGTLTFAASLTAACIVWRPAKSNLREVAALVSAEADREDLVVVFPATLAPTFRRYARANVRVVTFPSGGGEGPTRFADYTERFEDPAERSRVTAQISRAAGIGRQAWLVVQVRRGVGAVANFPAGTIERWRHSFDRSRAEVSGELIRSFGPPSAAVLPRGRDVRELVRVERYGPGPESVPD